MNKLLLTLAILGFYVTLQSQDFNWEDQGTDYVQYDSQEDPTNMHFYKMDDGYYRKMMHPNHFYTAGNHTTTYYTVADKEGHDPRKKTKAIAVQPHINIPAPFRPLEMDATIETTTSWNLTQDYSSFLLLQFQNDFLPNASSGCITMEYNPAELTVQVDPARAGWAQFESHDTGNGIIKWTYNNLQSQEQRVIYLPTISLVDPNTTVIIRSILRPQCGSVAITTDNGQTTSTYPHDPNRKTVTNVKKLAVTEFLPMTQNQELIYKVEFYNSGNGFAHNVRVDDIIHSNADPSSINIIKSSHPITFISIINDKLVVNFNNIELPGRSQTIPETYSNRETEAYFIYSICVPEEIETWECMPTFAEIFFDNQPGIIASHDICAEYYNINQVLYPCSNGEYYYGGADIGIKTDELNEVAIFPIPASNNITISNISMPSSLRVFDQMGKSMNIFLSTTNSQESINIGSLTKGFYILEIKNGESVKYEKFIKE